MNEAKPFSLDSGPEQPEEQIFMILYDVARLFRRDFHRRSRSHNTTRAQWAVLVALARHEGARQVQLADILEIEAITLVRLLDRLEEAGLVERRADPTDRRARTLHLTPASRPVFERIREIGKESRDLGLSGLTDEEKKNLRALLERIRSNFAERSAPTDDGQVAGSGREKGISHA
jgi:DNA-binding MarR family transcriptional regulator